MPEVKSIPSRNEFIADARIRFEMLGAIRILTESQVNSIVHILECEEGTLSGESKAFRKNILRYLRKEADFKAVFADMLAANEGAAPLVKEKQQSRGEAVAKKVSKDSSGSRGVPERSVAGKAHAGRKMLTVLPPSAIYFMIVALALPVGFYGFTKYNSIFSSSPEVTAAKPKRNGLNTGSEGGNAAASLAVFPSAISPLHANEGAYEASLNTCYDQFKQNRETNANGGLKWSSSSGRSYYSECLEHLKQ
ncbi:MAG TPA: hypothetical protein VEK34_13195 [Methylocella sp.]|nr:hypothetical protein [Methylocella sp.]